MSSTMRKFFPETLAPAVRLPHVMVSYRPGRDVMRRPKAPLRLLKGFPEALCACGDTPLWRMVPIRLHEGWAGHDQCALLLSGKGRMARSCAASAPCPANSASKAASSRAASKPKR